MKNGLGAPAPSGRRFGWRGSGLYPEHQGASTTRLRAGMAVKLPHSLLVVCKVHC
jgi:hypothetical protein